MRLADAYPEIPALVFRGQTRYRMVWRFMRRRIERWITQHVQAGGVAASALGAVGLEYKDLGLNTWGVNSMPLDHITLKSLCLFCEVSGLQISELLPPSERALTLHEQARLLDLLTRARSALLELEPGHNIIPEISAAIDSVSPAERNPLPPKEEPTPLLSAARLPAWMRQRI